MQSAQTDAAASVCFGLNAARSSFRLDKHFSIPIDWFIHGSRVTASALHENDGYTLSFLEFFVSYLTALPRQKRTRTRFVLPFSCLTGRLSYLAVSWLQHNNVWYVYRQQASAGPKLSSLAVKWHHYCIKQNHLESAYESGRMQSYHYCYTAHQQLRLVSFGFVWFRLFVRLFLLFRILVCLRTNPFLVNFSRVSPRRRHFFAIIIVIVIVPYL